MKPANFDLIHKNLSVPGCRVILYGPPGTGKTTAATKVGLQPGQQVHNLTITEEFSAAEARGHWIPSGEAWSYFYGPCIVAMNNGDRLVVNEIDKAGDDFLALMYFIADDPDNPATKLTLPNNEVVRPAPGFSIVATMNGDPSELPDALRDRFAVQLLVKDPSEEAIESLPEFLRDTARRLCALEDENRRVSFRQFKTIASLLDTGMTLEEAVFSVLNTKGSSLQDSLAVAMAAGTIEADLPETRRGLTTWSDYNLLRDIGEGFFCGWCQSDECGYDDSECRPSTFVDREEFFLFVIEFRNEICPSISEETLWAVFNDGGYISDSYRWGADQREALRVVSTRERRPRPGPTAHRPRR